MHKLSIHLLSVGLTCLCGLPVWAEQQVEPPLPTLAGATDADVQKMMDMLLADQQKSNQAALEAASPAGLGKRIDALLTAAAKAREAEKTTEYYAASWKLLRLLPEVACKSKEARKKIGAVSLAVQTFLTDNERVLDHMSANYLRFRQKLGLRSEQVEKSAQKLGMKGAIDPARGGTPTEGDIDLSKATGEVKVEISNAEKGQVLLLESALKKLIAVDGVKPPADYGDLWKNVAKNLDTAWFFQVAYKQDPRIGETDPETLKFLRSLNHGLGDLSRYEELATSLGWDLNQLDLAAGLTPETGATPRLLVDGAAADQTGGGAAATGNGDVQATLPAGGARVTTAAPDTTAGDPGAATATDDAPVAAATATAGPDAEVVDDWQAKLDAQLKKPDGPPAAVAADPGTLDAAAEELSGKLRDAQQNLAKARADNDAETYFKSMWQILRLLPETAYKTDDTRRAMAADNEVKSLLTANAATVDSLAKLYVRFKQKLGLRSQQVETMARRMGVRGNVDETRGAAANTGGGDINLDAAGDKTAAAPATINATERYKIQSFETYLTRLGTFEKTNAIANAERELKDALKNLDGAYYFQVLYKQDPNIGAKYPNTLKYLQTLNGGLGDLRAYEEVLKRNGWSIDDNGELVRPGRGDNNGNNAGDNDNTPRPNWPRPGGGGGGNRGNRGGRGGG